MGLAMGLVTGLVAGLTMGLIKTVIDRSFPLEQVAAAHRDIRSKQGGKINLLISRTQWAPGENTTIPLDEIIDFHTFTDDPINLSCCLHMQSVQSNDSRKLNANRFR